MGGISKMFRRHGVDPIARKAGIEPFSVGEAAGDAVDDLEITPKIPEPPALPAFPVQPPDITVAADRARQQREAADAQSRKRGRLSTVRTGPEGVGSSPVGVKTLVGS